MDEFTHIGYADESYWNVGQFRSIALVTAARPTAEAVAVRVAHALEKSNVSEFAWNSLRTDNTLAAANAMIEITLNTAYNVTYTERLRVDVLTWDTQDSRHHNVLRRDDAANMGHLYYRLIITVIERRWPKGLWLIRPDEQSNIDFEKLEKTLAFPSRKAKASQQLVLGKQFAPALFGPPKVVQSTSDAPLIQVADLFAGLSSFSWNDHQAYQAWKSRQNAHQNFPGMVQDSISSGKEYKSRALNKFENLYVQRLADREQKDFSMRRKGLITRNPNNHINFWLYTPQGAYDKAPQRP